MQNAYLTSCTSRGRMLQQNAVFDTTVFCSSVNSKSTYRCALILHIKFDGPAQRLRWSCWRPGPTEFLTRIKTHRRDDDLRVRLLCEQ